MKTLLVIELLSVNDGDTISRKQPKMLTKCRWVKVAHCGNNNAEIPLQLIQMKEIVAYLYIYIYIYIYFCVYVQIVMQRYKDRSLHTRKMHKVQTEAYFISKVARLCSPLEFFWSNLTKIKKKVMFFFN